VNGNRHKWRLNQALETVGAIRLMLKARLFPRLILLPTIGTDDPQCRHFTASTRISSTQNGHFRMAAWPCLDCRHATASPMRDTTPQARATSAKTSAPAMASTSASASRIQPRIRQGTINYSISGAGYENAELGLSRFGNSVRNAELPSMTSGWSFGFGSASPGE
jgi:hypothetical protein